MRKFTISLISLLIFVIAWSFYAINAINAISDRFTTLVGFTLYFIYTLIVYYWDDRQKKKTPELLILLFILIGIAVFILFDCIGFIDSFPNCIIFIFGVLSGYLCFKVYNLFSKSKVAIVIAGFFCFSMAIWASTRGIDYWLNNKNTGTYTGRLKEKEVFPLSFQTATGDTVKVEDFSGKYLVLDCWYTYCGSCYEKFPKVQKLYERYKNNENIVIYSLHSRMEEIMEVGSSTWGGESYSTGTEILKREGYSFPTLSIYMNDPVLREEVGVWVFPTVLIFDKESRLIFRGSVDLAERYLRKIIRE
jgi:thiol-disulfide isomerase/thioredoxin